MSLEIKIPDLGENISGGRVVAIQVSVGDTIETDQILMELETDKAVLEVPSPASGLVEKIKIAEGDDIAVGATVLLLKAGAATDKPVKQQKEEEKPVDIEQSKQTEKKPEEPVHLKITQPETVVIPELPGPYEKAPAAPSVRRFAREIGIHIHVVPGSGPSGRISVDDVKAFAKNINLGRTAVDSGSTVQHEPLPDFSKWGAIERQSMSKLRETAARHLSYAWSTIPHVTQFDKADITNLEKLRKQYAPIAEKEGGKLTVTAILLKVIEKALKKFPKFNASIDMQTDEVIYKKYFNIGVAVDTEHGLLVPVVKDVQQKSILGLASELTEISVKARDRKLGLDDMQGGNFSISNLGGIGGTGFTPVVNSPEVAILGVSRSEIQPVYEDGSFVPKLIMPLSLSYDHRIIDGADAARFLRWVCQALEEPFLLSLEG